MIPFEKDVFLSTKNLDEAIEAAESQFKYSDISLKGKEIQIVNDCFVIADVPAKISKSGIMNVCDALRIPDPFAERIPDDLFIHNVNRLFKEKKDVPARIFFDESETIVDINFKSNVPVTSGDMLRGLKTRLKETGGEHARFEFQNHKLVIEHRLMSPEVIQPRVGDLQSLGFMIQHYPTAKSISIGNLMMWTLRCTNGALMPAALGREKLVNKENRKTETILNSFLEGVLALGGDIEHLKRVFESLYSQTCSFKLIKDWVKKCDRVLDDRDEAYKCINKSFGEDDFKAVSALNEDEILELSDIPQYDLYYATTDLASNKLKDIFQSKRLKSMAGNLLFDMVKQVA